MNIGLIPSKLDASVLESCYLSMAIMYVKQFNNKYIMLIPYKFDYCVLYLMVIKSHWYVDICPLHTNISSVFIGSSVLILHSIFSKVRDLKNTSIVPNTNLLKYLIPPLHAYSNMFV